MSGRSWVLALATVLTVAACGPPSADLSPRQAVVPESPYGLVVGVVAVARTPGTPSSAASAVNALMTYKQQQGLSGDLLLATSADFWRPEVYEGVEDGLAVTYRPFALKLPAVRTELASFDTRWQRTQDRQEYRAVNESYKDQQGKWQTRTEWKWVTVTDYIPVVNATNLPVTGFDVAVGKVRYIGRLGMVVHAERSLGPGPARCLSGMRDLFLRPDPSQCLTRTPFMENREAADLAMIRQHFPGLAGVEIETRPLDTAPGSWQTLTDAARSYAVRAGN